MFAKEFRVGEGFPPVSYADWKKAAEASLKGVPFKKLLGQTYEGIELQPIYTEETAPTGGDPAGFPGFFPFVRGTRALGLSRDGWDIRQQHIHPDPDEVNAHIRDDLEHGVTSIQLRFSGVASLGLDADDPRAGALAAGDGVMLHTTGDLEHALASVPLDKPVVFLDSGGAFLPAAALLVATASQRGVAPHSLRGAFNADPLGALMRDGQLTTPIEVALAHLGDLAAWTAHHAPAMHSVEVCTSPYHHAGSSSTEDLAFMMATGLEYLRAMTRAGLDVDTAARQILFSDSLGCHFFRAVAKLRAARWLWAKVVARCGGDTNAQRMYLRVRTSRRVLTVRDPWINMLRNTVCAFAGVIGGADAITIVPFDAAFNWSDAFGRHNARSVQLLLRDEAQLHRVVDPAGGSWYLEALTRHLAEKAWGMLQEIEAQGGMVRAALGGWVARAIESTQTARKRNIHSRRDPITGVSEHPDVEERSSRRPPPDLKVMSDAAQARLAVWRRDHACQEPLKALSELARSPSSERGALTAAAVRAAQAGATIGQLASALASKDSEPARVMPLAVHPYEQAFQELRHACDLYLAKHKTRPRVFLAGVGAVKDQMARLNFARSFFEAGGFKAVCREGPADVAAAVDAFRKSRARIAVICSTDQQYETVVEELAPKLRAAGARTVVLAGQPGASEARYRAAGVDRFIFIKCDVIEILRSLLQEEGVLS